MSFGGGFAGLTSITGFIRPLMQGGHTTYEWHGALTRLRRQSDASSFICDFTLLEQSLESGCRVLCWHCPIRSIESVARTAVMKSILLYLCLMMGTLTSFGADGGCFEHLG